MRILRVISTLDPSFGGPVAGASLIDAELIRLGAHVEVVCLDGPDLPFHRDYPAPVHALGPGLGNYGYARRLGAWLVSSEKNFDVAVINGLWQYHSFAARRAFRRAGLPYLVFTHGMLDPWFKRAYPLKHVKKWIYWPWGDYRVLRHAAGVLFTSDEERIQSRQSFWLYRCNELVTPYGTSGPPLDASILRERFYERNQDLRSKRLFLFLGRIHHKKGCDLLVEAFAGVAHRNPEVHLVMAGPDQVGWRRELEMKSAAMGISDRITWMGMLKGEEKWRAYAAAEVFCLPSHQENFGIAVAEALSCGTPVLVSDKVNIWREILADEAGLVRPNSLAGTVSALEDWMSLPSDARERMGLAARSCFVRRFSVHEAARSLLETFRRHRRPATQCASVEHA
jgi:glycosyltransferase involved in cell wall biosynthesis